MEESNIFTKKKKGRLSALTTKKTAVSHSYTDWNPFNLWLRISLSTWLHRGFQGVWMHLRTMLSREKRLISKWHSEQEFNTNQKYLIKQPPPLYPIQSAIQGNRDKAMFYGRTRVLSFTSLQCPRARPIPPQIILHSFSRALRYSFTQPSIIPSPKCVGYLKPQK